MTRDEFELEYAKRHMNYDPRPIQYKVDSVRRLADIDGYSDTHIDLCWRIQKIKNIQGVDLIDLMKVDGELHSLEW